MKLGTKIAIVMSALTTTVLSTLGVLDVERDRSFFEADTTHDQLTIANVLASGAERQLQAGRDQDVTALLSSETRREGQLEVVWGWLDPPALGAVPRMSTELTARLARAGWLSFRTEGANAKQWTMVPGAAADGRHFFVAVGESLQPERAHLIANAVRTGGSILLLALLCSGAIVAIGRRFVGKPVESLVEHARRVAAGDLTRRLHVGQNDEIGVLAREMNTMTEELASSRTLLERETERRLATVEQLRHADRLTTVGKLASGLAHELGTPLNVVLGYGRMISTSGASDEVRRQADTIVNQTDRMTHLVRQLLDFARRKGPQKRELELGAMARHVTGVLATMARKRGVGLVSETPAEAYVDADPTMIEQVLTNLVFNAIQASPKGARAIRVSTTTCSLSEPPAGRPRGDYARVRVEDHGDGIEPENVARIFEPFFTTKDVGEGTGLGLSVSYGIVEDHGGFMDVSSQLGVGTTFDVYLPAGQHGHVS